MRSLGLLSYVFNQLCLFVQFDDEYSQKTILILSSLIADNIGSGKGGSVTIVRALTAHKYV